MKRRTVLTSVAGTLLANFCVPNVLQAKEESTQSRNLISVSLSTRFDLSIDSPEIDVTAEWKKSGELGILDRTNMSLIHLNWGVLHLNHSKNLTALFDADVQYIKDIDYWISTAVFDNDQRLLGASIHREAMELNGGFIERNHRTFTLDFGRSTAFDRTRYIAIAISDRTDSTAR